jgi:hypothetical protein
MKLCLFDIENMYTNLPTMELKNIIKNILNNDHYTNKEEKEELLYIYIGYDSRTELFTV